MSLYIVAPFFAWFVAGSIKFLINSFKARRLAFDLIGYGGLPSTHSSIVSCAVALIWIREGPGSPILLIALTVAFIVILDASSLRQQVGKQAEQINKLNKNVENYQKLRERIGHSKIEVLTGIVTGAICAYILHSIDFQLSNISSL